MDIEKIIGNMNKVINNQALDGPTRRTKLESLAEKLWKVLMPGHEMGNFHEALKGNKDIWLPVSKVIDTYENKELLERVIEWPASGGDLSNCKR